MNLIAGAARLWSEWSWLMEPVLIGLAVAAGVGAAVYWLLRSDSKQRQAREDEALRKSRLDSVFAISDWDRTRQFVRSELKARTQRRKAEKGDGAA